MPDPHNASANGPARRQPVRVAVIPAAGLGTRFLPVTKTIPKEMLPLLDRPVIDFVISEVVAAGVEEVIVVSAPGKRALDAYFEAAPALEQRLQAEGREADLKLARRGQTLAKISIVYQEQPLGNGHAVLCARELVGERPFLMIWGDDITVADPPVAAQLVAVRERMGGGSVAAVMRVPKAEAQRYGVIDGEELDDRTWRVRGIIEKPAADKITSDIASVHGYLLEPEIFPILAALQPGRGGEIWLTDAVNILAQRAPVYACRFTGERFDTGDRAGYVRAVISAALARPELAHDLRTWLAARLTGR
ncbi:MAG TPA: UTP--glucose-1-phosphate uridylyltransferase [Gammaproteobacteria bacterium]|nr:UTP--glucose-1-phosphate uridylyltransferase [Gammaproteobacteria bacterium]